MAQDQLEELADLLIRGGGSPELEDEFCRAVDRLLRPFVSWLASGCGKDVEDLMQEAVVKVIAKLNQRPLTSPLASWIITVACNHCRDEIRRNRRRGHVFVSERDEEYSAERADERTEAPFARIISDEARALLDHALAELDPECRQIILEAATLRLMAGKAGSDMHSSPAERQRLSRCRGRLRKIYERLEARHG